MSKNLRVFLIGVLALAFLEIGFFAYGSWRAMPRTTIAAVETAMPETPMPAVAPADQDRVVPEVTEPTPTVSPTPQPTPVWPVVLMASTATQLLESPGDGVIQWLTVGQQVEATALENGYYKVSTIGGERVGYVAENALDIPDGQMYYAQPSVDMIDGLENRLVDVRWVIPKITVNMVYATPNNLMGKTVYDRDVCLLQWETALKLKEAQRLFELDGYSIKIYDAYRPLSVQRVMYDMFPMPGYVANPDNGSDHNRGAALDVTLIDAQGNELEMPSPVDTLDQSSHRDGEMSDTARLHMQYMTMIMEKAGFTGIRTEWWHYADSDASLYPVSDVVFGQLKFEVLME